MHTDNYPVTVTMTKYHLKGGTLGGMKTTERMGFMTWSDACAWAGDVTMSPRVPYVVLEMTNEKTGQKELF